MVGVFPGNKHRVEHSFLVEISKPVLAHG